ncbi:MAG: class I SAM-dependent methyltransferase [Bacteroidetes bacterium]|nr:MAG: class I SAM-dependent methyltransferase [Bacteroidota bacterium]
MKEIWFETNRKLWDAKTPIHLKAPMYKLEQFKKTKNGLEKIVLDALADQVAGHSMLHLQCHFGQDTLSFAHLGARVTGVDFSPEAIKTARRLARDLDLDARFILSNIYDLPQHLDEQFDFVFTSYGTIVWLPDLTKWAQLINRYLKPGGTFYIAEFHPYFYTFNFENWQIEYPYFNPGTPFEDVETGTYADRSADIQLKEYFWCHALAETLQPLLDEGLVLKAFREFDYTPWDCFPGLRERAPGEFVIDKFSDLRLPYIFSFKMEKPT